jgi:hypothetical protein
MQDLGCLLIDAQFDSSNISDANDTQGSQSGSHRLQTSGDAAPQPATIAAANLPVQPHWAVSADAPVVPSKQRVAGSNPARRTIARRTMRYSHFELAHTPAAADVRFSSCGRDGWRGGGMGQYRWCAELRRLRRAAWRGCRRKPSGQQPAGRAAPTGPGVRCPGIRGAAKRGWRRRGPAGARMSAARRGRPTR